MAAQELYAFCQQLVLAGCVTALLVGYNSCGVNGKRAATAGLRDRIGQHSYSTEFPLTENPIGEDGAWVGGSGAGANLTGSRLWGNVQTSHGLAYGVDEPTKFGDPTAILAGTWGPTQSVTATVRISKVPTGNCCHEVELRLRTAITFRSITGYEAYCSVMPDHPYCHIARWNGPNGSYWNFESQASATYLADGDVITATATGTNPTVITLLKNRKQILQAKDTGAAGGGFGAFGPWTSGNPGLGFYDNYDQNWASFGLCSFRATDQSHELSRPD